MMGIGSTSLFWIWPLLVVVGLALLGYAGYRFVQGRPGGPAREQDRSDARRILDERFARGEIDEAEYRRRRSTLR
jgi:putative membrane protein